MEIGIIVTMIRNPTLVIFFKRKTNAIVVFLSDSSTFSVITRVRR